MSHSPTPAVHSTQTDELPWVNDSTLLSQTRSYCDGQVVLHVLIVRKNCPRSIVLKQNQWHLAAVLSNLMSLSSGSLYSRELNLVTWGHSAPDSSGAKPQGSNPGHPWELYGISPAGGGPGMTNKDFFQARLVTPGRGLFICGKRHRTGFEE